MRIGIVGCGVVGSACKFGFELIGHTVYVHDIAIGSKIQDIWDTDVVFVCVPTPSLPDGSCDTSIVESVVSELMKVSYRGVIAIKSTVSPGTCSRLYNHYYPHAKICMVPEFLRERCAITDFTENHDLLVIGTPNPNWADVIIKCHGELPKATSVVELKEAEFVKYFNNTYNATLITFANSFYDICQKEDVDYSVIMKTVSKREHISKNYLQCNPNFRGFGGVCLPKDTRAMAALEAGTNITFFSDLLKQNEKFKITVLPGMRNE
jgi:UDPglucose 6-dehydrogenase